jgi:5'-nucleotidase
VRILVTNDDGIESEGLHALVGALAAAGHDVVVVAPDRDWSGASSALGRMHPDEHIDVQRVEVPGAEGVEAWALAGPPALTVLATVLGAFGELPDVVVSGINAGANTGRAILHSGTVGAVLTGQNFGLSGLAVSAQSTDGRSISAHDGTPWFWETAATVAVEMLPMLAEAPPRTALNLNVPALSRDEVKGVRWARLAPFGEVRTGMAEATDGRLQFVLRAAEVEFEADTDQGLLRDGYAALTTLVGIAEAWPADEGLAEGEPTIEERLVPGAPLHEVHQVPDASGHGVLRRPRLGAS